MFIIFTATITALKPPMQTVSTWLSVLVYLATLVLPVWRPPARLKNHGHHHRYHLCLMSPKMTITNTVSLHITKLTLVTDFNVDFQAGWEHGQRTNTRRCVCINFYNRSLNMENSHHPHPHPRSPHSPNSSQIWRIFTLSTILRRSSLAIVETWV